MRVFDAAIIGGGPAGSTAARLLAQWGHSVVILTAPPVNRPGLAECLPPSTRKLFRFLGIDAEIDAAGFFPTTGNTVWWGKSQRRVETYPDGWGYQVPRVDFDRLLLELAQSAGARVQLGKAFSAPSETHPRLEFQSGGKRTKIHARFILDCSGRAGVLGRSLRVKETNSRTIALCGVWRNEQGWKLPDASHTLVEAYCDGWAWSVPVSPTVRYVAFMVEPGHAEGVSVAYQAELSKTRAFRKIFSHGVLERIPWGNDASLYSSKSFAGPGFLLAGDAGAFIDPLASFGVKKAMVSAWVGAVVANTCLRRPAMQDVALQFFDDRERQVYASYLRQSAAWFRTGSDRHAHPFWFHRSEPIDTDSREGDPGEMRAALANLKQRSSVRLRRAKGVRIEPRPGIEGREIAMRDALVPPGEADGLDFFESVNLPRLVETAELHSQVPDLYEAYNRACPPVALPNFLAALSMLLARKLLILSET